MKFTMKRAGKRAGEVTADAWLCPLPDPFSQLPIMFRVLMLIVHFAMIV